MVTGAAIIALSESFREMRGAVDVLDALENQFRSFGANHFLATGVPLPGRPIEPLILRMDWRDARSDRAGPIKPDDPLIQTAIGAKHPFVWLDTTDPRVADSVLLAELGTPTRLIGIPICAFLPYQAVVLAGGPDFKIDTAGTLTISHFCVEAFRRLFEIGFMKPERPGDLSARERRVVSLSACGKTANEIAAILEISQRTVHAHLQNASEKLRAHNKTHTVVKALRYGQITV